MRSIVQGGKYLTFILGGEEFGLAIRKVKEINGIMPIYHIPNTYEFVKGVINLRGKIIPVMDLRLKFGLPSREYDNRTCLIVVEIGQAAKLVAVVVDAVSEVLNVVESDIEVPPDYTEQAEGGYLAGIGKVKDKVILILDIDKVVDSQTLVVIRESIGSYTGCETN